MKISKAIKILGIILPAMGLVSFTLHIINDYKYIIDSSAFYYFGIVFTAADGIVILIDYFLKRHHKDKPGTIVDTANSYNEMER